MKKEMRNKVGTRIQKDQAWSDEMIDLNSVCTYTEILRKGVWWTLAQQRKEKQKSGKEWLVDRSACENMLKCEVSICL